MNYRTDRTRDLRRQARACLQCIRMNRAHALECASLGYDPSAAFREEAKDVRAFRRRWTELRSLILSDLRRTD